MTNFQRESFDLLIIGGGVNGCGIARDAAGRGLKVLLCEMGDLSNATSSSSTKLFHGGLRYLEYYKFRLVRESLIERENLLSAMPHISWPLRFILPHHDGLRPAWLLRLGLFIYDHLGGRKVLPPTKVLNLTADDAGKYLKACYKKAFEYSDCWVDDSRLVILNARDAAEKGATVLTQTRVEKAERQQGKWKITANTEKSRKSKIFYSKAIVNASGPWVSDVSKLTLDEEDTNQIRLVKGSHIVTNKLFDHDRPYIFQQNDGRIIFAIPYEYDYTLIGTTDQDIKGDPGKAHCSPEEAQYLLKAAGEYFNKSISLDDIVWSYSGVRPLFDDGANSATSATRDYSLELSTQNGKLPLLNVYGGKITTYRKLAEAAVERLNPWFSNMKGAWTRRSPLPGGDFPINGVEDLISNLKNRFPFLSEYWAKRLIRAYGTDAKKILGEAKKMEDLGKNFGATLTEKEVNWLIDNEWANCADDVIWRRSKLGLRLNQIEQEVLQSWISGQKLDSKVN